MPERLLAMTLAIAPFIAATASLLLPLVKYIRVLSKAK